MVERCGGVVEGGGVGGGGALSMPTVVRTKILSVFCRRKAAAKASSPCKQGEPRGALSWRGGRLHQVPLSSRAVSLPQSFCALWAQKIQLCPLAVSRSCFGCSLSHLRTAAACLSRCIRHWRRSKAKPLRGSRGRLPPQRHRISAVYAAAVTPAGGGRTSSVTVQRKSAAPCHLPQGEG